MSRYTVKTGDTLWKIAEKLLGNGDNYSEIQCANNLRDAAIYPGQVLIIPGGGRSTTKHRTTKHGATNYVTSSDDDDTTPISVCNKVFSCKTFFFL
jgi:LysM repeat protein